MAIVGEPSEIDDLGGYSLHTSDGAFGKVDRNDISVGSSYLAVATGPWILGRIVLLPSSVIERVDHRSQVVYVTCTTDQIKTAPKCRSRALRRFDLHDYYASVRLGPLGGGGL